MAKLDIPLNESGPGYPAELSQPSTSRSESYPQFHYEGAEELEELGVPDEGTMTVEYRVVRETCQKRQDGTEWYSCDVQLRKILSAKGSSPESPTRSGSEAGDALDKLAAEKYDEGEE